MSRPPKVEGKPRNIVISTKMHEAGVMALDEMAKSYGLTRAEMLRRAVAEAWGKYQRNSEVPSE